MDGPPHRCNQETLAQCVNPFQLHAPLPSHQLLFFHRAWQFDLLICGCVEVLSHLTIDSVFTTVDGWNLAYHAVWWDIHNINWHMILSINTAMDVSYIIVFLRKCYLWCQCWSLRIIQIPSNPRFLSHTGGFDFDSSKRMSLQVKRTLHPCALWVGKGKIFYKKLRVSYILWKWFLRKMRIPDWILQIPTQNTQKWLTLVQQHIFKHLPNLPFQSTESDTF